MAIKIVTDSTSYLTHDLRQRYDIAVVSLSVAFGTESYLEESISQEDFYAKMATAGTPPVSSQPSPQALRDALEKPLAAGDSVVGIFLSSEMSGTFASAQATAAELRPKYPGQGIEIIDSRSNCMQLGFAVLAGAKAAQGGGEMAQVLEAVHKNIRRSRFLFIPQTLDYLKKGGRIGGAAHLFGTLLNIRPILTVIDGRTAVLQKVRTQERAIREILAVFLADVRQKGLAEVAVHHIADQSLGEAVARMIQAELEVEVPVCPIGPVIGCHVGPGTVGLVYCTSDDL